MTAQTIYLACVGNFSDKKIHYAFTDQTMAETYCEQRTVNDLYGEQYYVEELLLIDELPPAPAVYWSGSAELGADGSVHSRHSATGHLLEYDGELSTNRIDKTREWWSGYRQTSYPFAEHMYVMFQTCGHTPEEVNARVDAWVVQMMAKLASGEEKPPDWLIERLNPGWTRTP